MSDKDFDLDSFLRNLPQLPGVYRMIDAKDRILYVGKAVNLKRRVGSYFRDPKGLSPRIAVMVSQIRRIEITATHSEAEALILESNFIKSLMPKYNILFRDDKSYPYIKISHHEAPQISYYRGALKKPHAYFGPYPNAEVAKETIDVLVKAFLLRTCDNPKYSSATRPCLNYQIKQCSAPCAGKISLKDYAQSVAQAADFLNGKTAEIIDELTAQMNAAAEGLRFEKAAELRDKIANLSKARSKQFIDSQSNDAMTLDIDVLAAARLGEFVCIHRSAIRKGRKVFDSALFPGSDQYEENLALERFTEAFMMQYYADRDKPDMVVSNFDVPDEIRKILIAAKGKNIVFARPSLGEKKRWLDNALENAELAIRQRSEFDSSQQARKDRLKEFLGMEKIERIECFDISHTFGEATVASCVVYEGNRMDHSQYRRFNIDNGKPGDDYAAMSEALRRRYLPYSENPTLTDKKPDLVIIDGGKGQLTATRKVWEDLGLDIPYIGMAKGPERIPGQEDIVIPFQNRIVKLDGHDPASLLLQTVRDESHRFAITNHRKKRDKARFHSELDDIPGVGPARKKELMLRFGSVKGVRAASIEDLGSVKGISVDLAERIFGWFHPSGV